jgi:hypothetical protein
MTCENRSPKPRSLLTFARRRAARKKSQMFRASNGGPMPAGKSGVVELHAYRQLRRSLEDRPKDDRALPASSGEGTWWRAVKATASGLMVTTLGSLAERGEPSFSSFPLAAASWIATLILEGCAAYAEGMYPIFLDPPPQPDPADHQKPDFEGSRRAEIIVLHGDRRG